MVSLCKVWTVLMLVLVVLMAALTTVNSSKFYRRPRYRPRSRRRYPTIEELQFALPGLLPKDCKELWHGFDAKGYSRNGRDLRYQMSDLTNAPLSM